MLFPLIIIFILSYFARWKHIQDHIWDICSCTCFNEAVDVNIKSARAIDFQSMVHQCQIFHRVFRQHLELKY